MRIAFISPRAPFIGNHPEFKTFFTQSPQTEFYRQYWSGLGSGLLILAALTPQEFDIELIDENVEDIDFSKQYDLVAISLMTQQATRAYEIAKKFKAHGATIVLGGIHPTVMPEEASLYADTIVVGEAEKVWPILLDDFQSGSLGKMYKTDEQLDLSTSPIPKFECIKDKPYKIVWMQATRGCPHDCSFCCASRVYGTKYRRKQISQIINEVKTIQHIKPNTIIGFADDNFLCDSTFAIELLKQIVPLNIKWIAQTDIRVAENAGLLKLIKKSGAIALLIGFESLSEENLKSLDSSNWKQKQSSSYSENIQHIQQEGIGVIGTFITGFDNDDESVFPKLANFIIDNHLAGAQIASLTPFPKTKIREQFEAEGRIKETSWENYTLYDVNIEPKKMSAESLQQGIISTFKKIYSSDVAKEKMKYFKDIYSQLT